MPNKRIYFDFETTDVNPLKADILEACFIFVEDRDIIEIFNSKIKIEKNFDELDKATLSFNGINSVEDLHDHNSKSLDFKDFFENVIKYYVEYFQDYKEGYPEKMRLTGWNNSAFDDIILKRYLSNQFYSYFNYNSRDIMQRFHFLQEYNFINIKGLALSLVFKDLISPIPKLNFHTAKDDCLAVKTLDEYLDDFNYYK